jgi:hypothetical protein
MCFPPNSQRLIRRRIRSQGTRPFWLRRDSARCQSRPFIHRNLGRSIKFHGFKVDVGVSRELLHGVDLRTVAACGFAHAGVNCVTGVGPRPGGDRSQILLYSVQRAAQLIPRSLSSCAVLFAPAQKLIGIRITGYWNLLRSDGVSDSSEAIRT